MDMDGKVPEVDRPQQVAVVKERIFIPSGSTKTVTLEGDVVRGDYLLCATHPLVEDSLCSVTEDGIANVTVCNDSGEHRVLHKGEVIGEWFRDGWMPVNVLADGADMMEKITENEVEGKERLQELLDVLKEKTPMTEELKRMIGSYSDVGFARVLKTEPEVTIVIYDELHDIPAELSAALGARTCIFVTPTSEKPYDKAEWCALGMAFTNIVRGGVKLIAISGPRGESAWSQNRKNATDMLDVVRDASAAMRSNVVTTFSSVPSMSEPSAVLGENTRSSPTSVYPAQATKSFLVAMHSYLRPHLSGAIYTTMEQPVSRKMAYREKKRSLQNGNQQSEREPAASSTYAPIRNFSHSFSGARGCGARRGHRGRFNPMRGSFRGGKGALSREELEVTAATGFRSGFQHVMVIVLADAWTGKNVQDSTLLSDVLAIGYRERAVQHQGTALTELIGMSRYDPHFRQRHLQSTPLFTICEAKSVVKLVLLNKTLKIPGLRSK
ncbi:hypothetical protein Aduo_009207 [Ancylostoma duodenale]